MEYNIKYILLEILKQYEYTAKYYACNIKIETGKLLDQGYENKNQAIIRKFCNLPQTEEQKLKLKTKKLPQTEEQKLKLKTKKLPQTEEQKLKQITQHYMCPVSCVWFCPAHIVLYYLSCLSSSVSNTYSAVLFVLFVVVLCLVYGCVQHI
jgi:hypothetical protein